MRLIKLVMSAFGPFKDRVSIDFDKVGGNGLFLISGETGSGKTTIFDAISFALFGEASGSRREISGFRSDFSDVDTLTFVELEFIHKDVVYCVYRMPKYMRAKKRGNGFTSVGGEASLTGLDFVITGDKNVTEKCVEILGVNASQFKQIVMLAQGEFLNLLLAKPKDRATIFRRIFNTYVYKDISDELKRLYLLKKREYDDIVLTIDSYRQGILLDGVDNLDIDLDSLLELLSCEIDNDLIKEKLKMGESIKFRNKSDELIELISEGNLINNSILSLNSFKNDLDKLFERGEEINSQKVFLQKSRDIWNYVMPYYEKIFDLKETLAIKQEKLENTLKDYNLVVKEYDDNLKLYNLLDDMVSYVQVIRQENDVILKKLEILKEVDLLNEELVSLNKLFSFYKLKEKEALLLNYEDLLQKKEEINLLKKDIKTKLNCYVSKNKEYVKNYDMFISSQAGILASNLEDGQPCPVCGSLSHPCLAEVLNVTLSKDEIDRDKKDLESMYQDLETIRLSLSLKEKEIEFSEKNLNSVNYDELVNEIDNLKNQCLGIEIEDDLQVCDIEKKIVELKIKINELNKSLDDSDIEVSLLDKLELNKKDISSKELEISNIKTTYDKLLKKKSELLSLISILEEDINLLKKDIDNLNDKYVKSYVDLGYTSLEDYMSIRLDKEDMNNLSNLIDDYDKQIIEVQSNINSLEKLIDGREMYDLDSYNNQLKGATDRLDEIDLYLKDINNKISSNKRVYNNLKDLIDKLKKIEKEVIIYKDLSDTANGSISGKNKLEFEQYVQASYFDMILKVANKRFLFMTDNRYELLRKEVAVKVSDKLGLELEVMDYYTGKRRDIKSLSGGESFKAALSLALGMSDVIQEFSGGVLVDAMFIDEGFGSLDEESLSQALDAIMMVGKNNKMIGIISHVNELKMRIDNKILVNSSSNGSSISFVV